MTNSYDHLPVETTQAPVTTGGTLTYENKVIEKIVGYGLLNVDGLLAVDGGFLNNLKNKVVNNTNVRDGINVEVGKKQVAVDLNVIVEYQKHIATIFENIKSVVIEEVGRMTDLEVVEVNVNVVDIKTREQHQSDDVTVQDHLVRAGQATSELTSTQINNAKASLAEVSESNEPRVV